MGFRDSWLKHEGNLSCISEVVLTAFDRASVDAGSPVSLLQIGVENGGEMQVWQDVLPQGSTVVGIDPRPECAQLGLPVLTGDPSDATWLRGALRDQWFDLIVCMKGSPEPVWPFLKVGGVCLIVNPSVILITRLFTDMSYERDSWLPAEEVQSMTLFPKVAVLEKRMPKVIPFMDVMTGSHDPVVPAADYIAQGGRWIAKQQKTSNQE
jgi:hypothetical protein